MIYLDNAATTFPKSDGVYSAMDEANRKLNFNSGRGDYKKASEATALIDDTKHLLKELVNAPDSSSVIFSSSITLALNQIIRGLDIKQNDNVFVTPYEHNAVARTVSDVCEKKGANLIELPLNESLEIDLEKTKYLFAKHRPKCVCCIHVSNVTGYIVPYGEIFSEAKKFDAITVLDTAQSLGLVDIDLKESQIDFLAFAGHKAIYGPMGIGGFIDNSRIVLDTYFTGGTGSDSLNLKMSEKKPNRYEASSQNIVAIAGLKQALLEVDVKETVKKEKELGSYLIRRLKKESNICLYLPEHLDDNHIGVISFNVNGYHADEVGLILDQDFDICVRSGYHCAPFIHKYLNNMENNGTVRIGLGKFNTKDDVDCLVDAIHELVKGE